jgi:drug/metabolite transporter (DMT)-like permease
LGWVILKEPVDRQTWIAILIGLAGVGVISSGAFASGNGFSGRSFGYIAAAIASLFYAVALVLDPIARRQRSGTHDDHAAERVFWSVGAAASP